MLGVFRTRAGAPNEGFKMSLEHLLACQKPPAEGDNSVVGGVPAFVTQESPQASGWPEETRSRLQQSVK